MIRTFERKPTTFLWRFDEAKEGVACGVVLDEVNDRVPGFKKIQWVREGLFSQKEWIEHIPEKSLVRITQEDMSNLGKNQILILTSNGSGVSPVLKKLDIALAEASLALAESKREAEAAFAKNKRLERQKFEMDSDVIKRSEDQKKESGMGKRFERPRDSLYT